jgi:hypothetical protein
MLQKVWFLIRKDLTDSYGHRRCRSVMDLRGEFGLLKIQPVDGCVSFRLPFAVIGSKNSWEDVHNVHTFSESVREVSDP